MQVSVADYDDLTDGVAALEQCYNQAQEDFASEMQSLEQLCEECEAELLDAMRELEAACEEVSQLMQKLADLQAQLQAALEALSAAEQSLQAAQSALAEAQNSGYYDEDGDYIEPDTSAEEAAVAAAEAAVEMAQNQVQELENQVQMTESELETAQEVQRICETRQELAQATRDAAICQKEAYAFQQQASLSVIEGVLGEVSSRVARARDALDAYSKVNCDVANFEKWLRPTYDSKQPVRFSDLADRLNADQGLMDQFARYCYQRDPEFHRRIDAYRSRLAKANGEAEKYAIYVQATRGGSGYLAEGFVGQVFKPLGDVNTQKRAYVDGKHYTKIDLAVDNLSAPVILGRGEGMGAQKGGSINIEVKTGKPDYIYRQMEHMEFQAQGHQSASASVTLVSRDVDNLPNEKKEELYRKMRESESPIIAALPQKEKFDKSVISLINE